MQRTQEFMEQTEDQEVAWGESFDGFSRPMTRELMAMAVSSSYPANVALFAERDEARGVFLILDGEVKLSINSKDGRRLSLRIAQRGEVLGLVSTLTGAPYEVTAETLYPTRIAAVGRRHFLNFLARRPEAYHALSDELSRDFATACEQLRTVALAPTAPKKLARLLLDWSESGPSTDPMTDPSARVRFSLTHEEIGEFIGASRETVTRILTSLKSKQLVALHGSTLMIPDKAALAEYAGA
jgi:CRP/FNR family transcriptional regulator, cyclic AMP receptor protein